MPRRCAERRPGGSVIRFWNLATTDPTRRALVEPDGRDVSAGDLLGRCQALTNALRALGLQEGDAIAAILPNGVDLVATYLAAMQAGWYLTPLNHHLTGPELGYVVGDCEAKVLIGHARFADASADAAALAGIRADRRFAVGGPIAGFRPLAELVDGASTAAPEDRTSGAIMYYTSGTTGRPKGVRRPLPGTDPDDPSVPFGDLLRLMGVEPTATDVHLCGSPLYHTAVLAFAADALHLGQTVVLMDRWSPEAMLDRIEAHGVTNTHMVPTQFHRLLALSEEVRAAADVSTLRYVVHGAAPCPPVEKRRMIEWWGPVIYEYYGTTEGGGTVVGPQEWLARPGTVGRPWPGAEIRVLDEDGADRPPGEPGTVYIKLGESDFEYFRAPEKTARSRIPGWFTVGDIGSLDDDGFLYLHDRDANLVISGGVNIYPAEVESALLTHPSVGDVAVFGIPDPDLGEHVHAVVEPTAGVLPGDDLVAALRAHCDGSLAAFKVPRTWDFVEQLPRDPSGKLFTRRLRDPYWARPAATDPDSA